MSTPDIDIEPRPEYDDYPACLTRYAWLLDGEAPNLYTPEPHSRCKACGALVPSVRQAKHRCHEQRQLAAVRKGRVREATARLLKANKLKQEANAA